MIESASGNLLEAQVEALVNAVNCVGVMGKGIALQFKQAFPANTMAYERACSAGELHPGRMLVVSTGGMKPKYIINFPTKQHWKGKSRIEYIRIGLEALAQEVHARGIKSIALPALGCGNGGLEWADVFALIEDALGDMPETKVYVYRPADEPTQKAIQAPGSRKRG